MNYTVIQPNYLIPKDKIRLICSVYALVPFCAFLMEEVNGKEGKYGNEKENVDEIPQKN